MTTVDAPSHLYPSMLVFARGVGHHAGESSSVQDAAKSGMEAVFAWWCTEGAPRGPIDKRDDALTVAQQAAEHFGFEDDVIESVSRQMMHSGRYAFSGTGRRKRRGSGPKIRRTGTYRFGALKGCVYGHGLKQLPPAR